jgi:hypothetical protein
MSVAALLMCASVARAEPPASGANGVSTLSPPYPLLSTVGSAAPAAARENPSPERVRPPPLHAEYAQYGVGFAATVNVASGATCGADVKPPNGSTAKPPCILGSGGGLAIRGGYRSPGPWYIGGAYEFTKMDSSNLYRLGIFQQLRAEMRYLPDLGYRTAPYVSFGIGGVAYGNEWGVETGGFMVFGGGGVEFEVSRVAVLGLSAVWRPTMIVGWRDTAGIDRPTGLAQFFGIELVLEVRTELGRR